MMHGPPLEPATSPPPAPHAPQSALPPPTALHDGLLQAPPAAIHPGRMYWIDNLRVFIIVVVLGIHMGNPYASRGWWYYVLPADEDISKLTSRIIMLVPSFSMAVLLVFSGYLLPSSFDRRGFRSYTAEKFIRLGIPLLIGGLFMLPLLQYYAYHLNWGYQGYASFWEYYWSAWHGLGDRPEGWNGPGWPDRNLSHLWYIEHLLFYALCYGLYRWLFARHSKARSEPGWVPGHLSIILFTIVVGLATFAVRVWWPYNEVTVLLKFLQIDISHFPQWLPFFFVGVAAWRYQWLSRLPTRIGYVWLAVAIAVAGFNIALAPLPWFEPWLLSVEAHSAGFTLPNLTKSMWETLWCVSATVGLITLFRECLNWQTPVLVAMAASAFAVHVFHPPIVVGLQFAMDGWPVSAFTRFVIGTLVSIVLCYTLAYWVILRIPYAKRVL